MKNKFNLINRKTLTFICGGFLFFTSCAFLNTKNELASNQKRKIAGLDQTEVYLSSGLYPTSLESKNVFDSEGRAKVVFNLPPYVNPGGVGIIPEMLKTINDAKLSIRMSVFQFNHAETFNALKRAIKRDVKVFIATDLCYSGKLGYKEYFDDLRLYMNQNGQSGESQVIDDKTASCDTMFNHNKYMIVDYEDNINAKAWFGSFNPTNHGSVENVELAIVVNDKKIAQVLKLDFDQQLSGKFKVNKNGVYSVVSAQVETIEALSEADVKALIAKGSKVSYPKVKVGDVEFEFILSPKVKSLTRIVEEVYGAKTEILFSSFAIADQMLISSLINKSNTTDSEFNLFSVLSLPHPSDSNGLVIAKNGSSNNNSTPTVADLKLIVDDIKISTASPVNYLTPKDELKSTFRYVFPKGELGGKINKVSVEGIFNSKVIDEKNTYRRLAEFKIPIFKSSLSGELHNKLFLIDESKVIFGSHNFSQSAENINDELTVIVTSPKLAKFLKKEYYQKTKLFSLSNSNKEESFTNDATLMISEIMSESNFKLKLNKKIADIGDYIEIYNYGEKSINLLGYRFDDHYFPDNNNDQFSSNVLIGFQGTMVRFKPNLEVNQLGVLDYNPANNILLPGKIGLIVGKYFNESFYKNKFIEIFTNKNGHAPAEADFPLLFSAGEYNSTVLGDGTSGLTSKDRITLYGIDGTTVIDRFNSPRAVSKVGNSIERVIDVDQMQSQFNHKSYSLQTKNILLKNGSVLPDVAFLPNYDFSVSTDWNENSESLSTPGIVQFAKRSISSVSKIYTIEGEYADVEANTFKKALIVVKDGKFFDITTKDNSNYPSPIIKDVLIFPGLIDAHNHIKYNTMPVWKVSKAYQNRNQWPEEVVYKNGIKELYKQVYGEWPECSQSDELERNKCLAGKRCKILKYAELKALIGGTTSIQGSSSFDENSSDITFKGLSAYSIGSGNKIAKSKARIAENLLDECSNDLARNIERELWHGTDEVRTTAQSIFADAFAKKSINDFAKFKQTPSGKLLEEFKNKTTNTFFVHLGEGVDESSRSEWNELDSLKLAVPQTTIIHGTAFDDNEFKVMGEKGLSLAWSPTSNLLLYKKTTNIPTALKNKVNVALGSDWSLSGTKSLLYELKVAAKTNEKYFKNSLSQLDLLKMVTINGARASHLENTIGSIDKNKLADFFIVKNGSNGKTPFEVLLSLNESSIDGVFVGGNAILGNFETINSFNKDLNSGAEVSFVKDPACHKNLALSMSSSEYNDIVNVLNDKTKNAFKALSVKLQTNLGESFRKLDPLCTDFDQRMLDVINSI